MGKVYRSVPARKKKSFWTSEIELPIPDVYAYSILAMLFMVGYSVAICKIPGFVTSLYRPPHVQEQPISAILVRKVPLWPSVTAGAAVGLVSVFLVVNRIDPIISLFLGIAVILDPGAMSMLTVTTASGIQMGLVLLGMVCATNTVSSSPWGVLWFVNLGVSWLATSASVLMNCDSCGAVVGLAVFYLLACMEWLVVSLTKSSRKDALWKTFGKAIAYYLVVAAFCAASLVLDKVVLDRYGWSQYEIAVADFYVMGQKLVNTSGNLMFLCILVLGAVLPLLVPVTTSAWMFVMYLVFTAAMTIFLPVLSVGDTIPRKIELAKLVLLLAAGIRFGTLQNQWYGRVAACLAMVFTFFGRLAAMRESMTKPLFS